MAAIGTVRASARARLPAAAVASDAAKYEAVAPDGRMYGVFGPQYSALLAQPTDSAALQVLNAHALRTEARNEQDRYEAQLTNAQAAQQELQRRAGYYGILQQNGDKLNDDVEQGMGGVRGAPRLDPTTGEYTTELDPTRLAVANGNTLNNDQATRYGLYTSGIKNVADAGFAPSPEDVGKLLTPPTQAEPAQYGVYQTPAAKTAAYSADEGMTVEEQMELARIGAEARKASDGQIEISVTRGENGVAQVVAKGSPEALAANGYDPVTGHRINPKADANSGTASATPTTAPVAKPVATPIVPQAAPAGNARPLAGNFFTAKNMTSPGGMRMHPIKKRMINHDGDDFGFKQGTPIPSEDNGVVIESGDRKNGYGNTVKVKYDNGAIISYSHNESNSVAVGDRITKDQIIGKVGSTGQSTGPHVHRKIWAQGVQPKDVYSARLKQHPNVQEVQNVGKGELLVTLKTGRKVVIRNGKVVG